MIKIFIKLLLSPLNGGKPVLVCIILSCAFCCTTSYPTTRMQWGKWNSESKNLKVSTVGKPLATNDDLISVVGVCHSVGDLTKLTLQSNVSVYLKSYRPEIAPRIRLDILDGKRVGVQGILRYYDMSRENPRAGGSWLIEIDQINYIGLVGPQDLIEGYRRLSLVLASSLASS